MNKAGSRSAVLVVALAAVLASGCYHAIVETGRQPSGTVVEDKWADSFLEGLVSPDAVDTAEDCPAGVARVETRRSFLNVLVGALTWGIYTPMEITVHCAAGDAEMDERLTLRADRAAGRRGVASAIGRAATLSAGAGSAVFVVIPE